MATIKDRQAMRGDSAGHKDDAGAPPMKADASAMMHASWETDPGEQIVAALRSYFLTHTFDFLTGDVYTVH